MNEAKFIFTNPVLEKKKHPRAEQREHFRHLGSQGVEYLHALLKTGSSILYLPFLPLRPSFSYSGVFLAFPL